MADMTHEELKRYMQDPSKNPHGWYRHVELGATMSSRAGSNPDAPSGPKPAPPSNPTKSHSSQLDRIEAKLDTILQAFEDEAAEDEDESTTITTMEGESINIPAGPMTL